LDPLHRARQPRRKPRGQDSAARLSKDYNRQGIREESRRFRLSPQFVVKEWSQLRIIRWMRFPDVRLFGKKRDVLCFCEEIKVDQGIGAVQSLQNRQREQKIPESSLVQDDYFPGLSRLDGTHTNGSR
jgi:hypothetical protein